MSDVNITLDFIKLVNEYSALVKHVEDFYGSLDYLGEGMDLEIRRLLLKNYANYISSKEKKLVEMKSRIDEMVEDAKVQYELLKEEQGANLADELEPEGVNEPLDDEPDGDVASAQSNNKDQEQWDEEEPSTTEILQAIEDNPDAEHLKEWSKQADNSTDDIEDVQTSATLAMTSPFINSEEERDSWSEDPEESTESEESTDSAQLEGAGESEALEQTDEPEVSESKGDDIASQEDSWGASVDESDSVDQNKEEYSKALEEELFSMLDGEEQDSSNAKKTLVGISTNSNDDTGVQSVKN